MDAYCQLLAAPDNLPTAESEFKTAVGSYLQILKEEYEH